MTTFLEMERAKEKAKHLLALQKKSVKNNPVKKLDEETLQALFVQRFGSYQEMAIRELESYSIQGKSLDTHKHLKALVKHTFFKYKLPEILADAFFLEEKYNNLLSKHHRILPRHPRGLGRARRAVNNNGVLAPATGRPLPPIYNKIDFKRWCLAVSQGRSLYKTETIGFLSKKETFLFQQAPGSLMPHQAIIHAVSMAESGNFKLAMMLSTSKLSQCDLCVPFWLDTVRFFSQENRMPNSKEDVDDFLDYISYRRRENKDFNLLGSGYSRNSLARMRESWHRDSARLAAIGSEKWEGSPMQDVEFKLHKRLWSFTQIKSAKELGEEGNAMRHCVGSYKSQCISGDISIWSVCMKERADDPSLDGFSRQMTLEVRRGKIVQARRRANRLPNEQDEKALNFWAKLKGLEF